MKHQALARVFAVVLAILCLLLLATGVRGFGKADEELAERRAWEEKYADRIQSYVELEAELAGSISYEEAQRELEKRLEQHESNASQHRTDTALHTAEKGGNQMGADLIWEAMPELASAKGDLEEAKQQLAQKEAAFAQGKAAITAQVNNGVAACNAERASLVELQRQIAGYLATAPTVPPQPAIPMMPVEVREPEPPYIVPPPPESDFVTATEPVLPEDPTEEELAEFPGKVAEYETLLAQQQEEYRQAMAAYEEAIALQQQLYEEQSKQYDEQCTVYEKQLQEYNQAVAQYETDKEAYDAAAEAYRQWSLGLMPLIGALQQEGAAVAELGGALAEAGSSLAALASALGGDGGGTEASVPGGGFSPDQTSPDKAVAAMIGAVDGMIAGYGQISAGLGAIEGGLTEARNKVFEGELALKKAEAEMQGQLENIWYNLGELEKEAEQLAEEKETLDQEASVLSKKILENEALKDLTNRRNSARQLLLNVAEVKSESAESGDLPGAAASYLERYRSETQALDEGRRRMNVLAILGAAAGLLGIPGAFELTKKRVLLLVPVLLCLGFAAGADWLHVSLGFGQMYTALFTAIFAAVQLLIVLPKKKTII